MYTFVDYLSIMFAHVHSIDISFQYVDILLFYQHEALVLISLAIYDVFFEAYTIFWCDVPPYYTRSEIF